MDGEMIRQNYKATAWQITKKWVRIPEGQMEEWNDGSGKIKF